MRFESVDTKRTPFILAESVSSKPIWDRLGFPEIADHLPLGVVLLNQRFELERFNHHYAAYIDAYSPCKPGEAIGRSYFSVVPGSDRVVGDWLKVVRERKQKVNRTGQPLPVQTPDFMKTTYWDVSMIPVVGRRSRFSGVIMMTHEVTERVEAEREKGKGLPGSPGRQLARRFGLTPREIQIALLLMRAKTSKEIADQLCVSLTCIEFHRDNIREKLGLKHTGTNLSTFLMAFLDP